MALNEHGAVAQLLTVTCLSLDCPGTIMIFKKYSALKYGHMYECL